MAGISPDTMAQQLNSDPIDPDAHDGFNLGENRSWHVRQQSLAEVDRNVADLGRVPKPYVQMLGNVGVISAATVGRRHLPHKPGIAKGFQRVVDRGAAEAVRRPHHAKQLVRGRMALALKQRFKQRQPLPRAAHVVTIEQFSCGFQRQPSE
jgi:hypothetical protein